MHSWSNSPPSPSSSFPCTHRAPSATSNPQLCLASWVCGQKHSNGDSTRKQHKSVLLRVRWKENMAVRRIKTILSEKREKGYRIQEKLYKLLRGYQNKCQAQPKPGSQRQREWLTSPGLKEKLLESFQEPLTQQRWPESTAQAGLPWELPTVREHRYQAPGTWISFCFIQNQGERSQLHLRAMTGVQREMSPLQCNSAHEATANAACSTRSSNISNVHRDFV